MNEEDSECDEEANASVHLLSHSSTLARKMLLGLSSPDEAIGMRIVRTAQQSNTQLKVEETKREAGPTSEGATPVAKMSSGESS